MRWASTSIREDVFDISGCPGNMNDQIAARAFGATTHYPCRDKSLFEYDAVFVTMWLHRYDFEPRWMDVVFHLKAAGKRVVVFQTAESTWPAKRPWSEQRDFIEVLRAADLFLTHQERDVHLWGSFTDKPSAHWKTCIDLDFIRRYLIEPGGKPTRPILFGSSFDADAMGVSGLAACKDLGHPLIHQERSSGYKITDAQEVFSTLFTELPNSWWGDWISGVSQAYVAVHPMTRPAAGRDQITFAALGLPCVGNRELDMQRILFPEELAIIDLCDPREIRRKVKSLLDDPEYYTHCRSHAMSAVKPFNLEGAFRQAAEMKERYGL